MSRLSDQDLVNIESVKSDLRKARCDSSNDEKTTRAESTTGMPHYEVTDDLERNILHRGKTYLSMKKSMMKSKDDSSEDILQVT